MHSEREKPKYPLTEDEQLEQDLRNDRAGDEVHKMAQDQVEEPEEEPKKAA